MKSELCSTKSVGFPLGAGQQFGRSPPRARAKGHAHAVQLPTFQYSAAVSPTSPAPTTVKPKKD